MEGKIIKGIAGFYYVHLPDKGVYECKARGIFRKDHIKPLIGDNVKIQVLEETYKKGNIEDILERKNALIRPTVANIDQVMLVFSVNHPKPNLNLLDRFLILIEMQQIPASICFNKTDTLEDNEINKMKEIYTQIGYPVYLTSVYSENGLEDLREALMHKTTAFAGPSGVGKSSILNLIQSETHLETGEISQKAQRGKHTTRHAELICFDEHSYVVDTPGFTSLDLNALQQDDLKDYFIEFDPYIEACKFQGCNHINEKVCGVKDALSSGKISESRYSNYCAIYEELKDLRRW